MDAQQLPHVLLVDDEAHNRGMLAAVLEGMYQVTEAGSAAEAIALAQAHAYDAAVVDFRMPGAKGTEALHYLTQTQPMCVRFLLTAYAEREVFEEAINRGQVYRYLQKPVDPNQLLVDLRRGIEHMQALKVAEQTARLAAVGSVAASVVHDLRNSLQALQNIPMLLQMPGDEPRSLVLALLTSSQQQMNALVYELTSLVKGETWSPDKEFIPWAHLANKALLLLRGTPQFADRKIVLDLPANLEPAEVAIESCTRMLLNLLRNALEATPADKQVGLRLRSDATGVCCTVWDEGTGIAQAHLLRLFEPLFTTKGGAGTGLGLWGARRVMQAHGGTLLVRSELGKGTAVEALFPRRAAMRA